VNEQHAFYIDSSALLKLYAEEVGSARVEQIVEAAPPAAIFVSRLAAVEITAGLTRRCRGDDLTESDLDQALRWLDDDFVRRFQVVEIGGAVMQRAVALVRQHGLRAADGIQLSCALISAAPDSTFVSSDTELNAAATEEGFAVLNPAQS
jgi:uncharacterized protein